MIKATQHIKGRLLGGEKLFVPSRFSFTGNLADDPEIQTGDRHALQDLRSAIAFTARVPREYFGRHYPDDLDNCINHAIVARHILKITFAIEATVIGGHAGWQYGPGAYDSVTCEDQSGTVYHLTAGGNFSGHARVEVAALIFRPDALSAAHQDYCCGSCRQPPLPHRARFWLVPPDPAWLWLDQPTDPR